MTQSLQFRLKSGQRIYINGAVVRVDRKVAIEFLNEATFMLDSHVLPIEDATTPLKQLYYTVQAILMDPGAEARIREVLARGLENVTAVFRDTELHSDLDQIAGLLSRKRYFECLKKLRQMFQSEERILESGGRHSAPSARHSIAD